VVKNIFYGELAHLKFIMNMYRGLYTLAVPNRSIRKAAVQ